MIYVIFYLDPFTLNVHISLGGLELRELLLQLPVFIFVCECVCVEHSCTSLKESEEGTQALGH